MEEKSIKIGINARLFPSNWRPLVHEIEFSRSNGFQAIQISVRDRFLDEAFLGDRLEVVAQALAEAQLDLAVELLIGVNANGYTPKGQTPLEILKTNLTALNLLRCKFVHWHLVPFGTGISNDPDEIAPDTISKLEKLLVPQFSAGMELSQKHNFTFGFEHNDPAALLFGHPKSCKLLMEAVPGLKFVWDVNHTIPAHLLEIQDLVADASIIHVSDTELPEVNYHLPLGKGTVDFEHSIKILFEQGFSGPAILEIGGLMKSGGYGRDTDAALIESCRHLQAAIERVRFDG